MGITRRDFSPGYEPVERGLSTNRPANPVEGRIRLETDTDELVIYSAGSWATVYPAPGGGGAPTTVNYLVGTADAGLSAEIVVGTAPGGELGGTWASPTVDASHSGSTHAAVQAAAEATAAGALTSHEADTTSVHGITDTSALATTSSVTGAVAAEATLARNADNLTSGTVADARIAATIARDSEVTSAISTHEGLADPHPGYLTPAEGNAAFQPVDSDLTAIAALTTTTYGRAFLELANQAALVALLPSYQPLDSDLTSLAALTTTAYGRALLELANQAALMGLLSASSATAQGIVELATDAETLTGTDTARATTPANVASVYLKLGGGTITGPLLLPEGTSSNPSIGWVGDPNTGFMHTEFAGQIVDLVVNAAIRTRWYSGGATQIQGGTEATLTDGTGHLQVGPSGGPNVGLDADEIQARSGGATATLNLQPAGGDVAMGGGLTIVTDPSTATGVGGRDYNDARNQSNVISGAATRVVATDQAMIRPSRMRVADTSILRLAGNAILRVA
jgi:hypothetical protein